MDADMVQLFEGFVLGLTGALELVHARIVIHLGRCISVRSVDSRVLLGHSLKYSSCRLPEDTEDT